MDLCSGLIMNVRIGPMLLSKTKDPTEGDVVNSIMSAIRHPMYIICGLIIKVGGVELCKYLLVPVILETYDIRVLKPVTDPNHLIKLRLLLLLYLIPVNDCIFTILLFLALRIAVA
jgi:hypothetical protein